MKDGDIINIDVTPVLDGFHGDTSRTLFVGNVSKEAKELVEVTERCMYLGIETIRPGSFTGDIGAAIFAEANKYGYGVVQEYAGHGTGRIFHGPPTILHFGEAGQGVELLSGMAFTVEPMLNLGTYRTRLLPDKWTAITADNKLSAQFEHTVLVTDDGVDILTK